MELPRDFRVNIFIILKMIPEFIVVGEYPYVQDTISSPCRNVGTIDIQYLPSGWTCPTYCLCGNLRILGIIDMGCYESPYVTGMAENNSFEDFKLKVFPNPFNEQATIEFYLENEMPVEVSLPTFMAGWCMKRRNQCPQTGKPGKL